uniref:Uncharacterized protein n=1 Tax=Klebsiella phage FKP3 TaxID=3231233 RepID=A0AAU8HYY0_9CAUD
MRWHLMQGETNTEPACHSGKLTELGRLPSNENYSQQTSCQL